MKIQPKFAICKKQRKQLVHVDGNHFVQQLSTLMKSRAHWAGNKITIKILLPTFIAHVEVLNVNPENTVKPNKLLLTDNSS